MPQAPALQRAPVDAASALVFDEATASANGKWPKRRKGRFVRKLGRWNESLAHGSTGSARMKNTIKS
jgi:hypothetical protein